MNKMYVSICKNLMSTHSTRFVDNISTYGKVHGQLSLVIAPVPRMSLKAKVAMG